MKTPEQLKGAIRNMAKEKKISAQAVLQIAMFERIIERLSVSKYRDIFILKGGLLISAMLGIEERTTMDMDTTIKGLPMEENKIREALLDIFNQPIDDGVQFQLLNLSPIRQDNEYENFCAALQAVYGKMVIPMKIDITTGDKITPREFQFPYPFLFEDRNVLVMAYTQETILAEKYETIIRRNIDSTRSRDFYDLYLLYRLYCNHADWELLKRAVIATAMKRESLDLMRDTDRIIPALEHSAAQKRLWEQYRAENTYAKEISFDDIIEVVKEFTAHINL